MLKCLGISHCCLPKDRLEFSNLWKAKSCCPARSPFNHKPLDCILFQLCINDNLDPFHSTEGYVICEEYQEVLVAAWENEESEREKKEKEVRITLKSLLGEGRGVNC